MSLWPHFRAQAFPFNNLFSDPMAPLALLPTPTPSLAPATNSNFSSIFWSATADSRNPGKVFLNSDHGSLCERFQTCVDHS